MPTVSVVIPCFDLGEFLEEAVASVLAQTYRDFDVVVVDDASTDPATRRLLDERWPFPEVRIVRAPENRGLSAARNLGTRDTTGRYLCSVDADDVVLPTWLERAVEVLDEDPGVAFVTHWLDAFGEESWPWRPQRCDLAVLLDANQVNGAALVRREVLEALGGFDESMREGCEDWELWLRAVAAGYRGVIVPEVMYRYRRRAESMSVAMHASGARLAAYRYMIGKHRTVFEDHLADLVLRREAAFGEMTRRVYELEEEHRTTVEPLIQQRRAEVTRARERKAAIEHERRAAQALAEQPELHAERAERLRLAREVTALRESWSWRLTTPLRRLAAALGVRGRGAER